MGFSDFFSELFGGPGSGGLKLPLRRFFETFRGFGVFGSVDGRRDPNSRSLLLLSCPHKWREEEKTGRGGGWVLRHHQERDQGRLYISGISEQSER